MTDIRIDAVITEKTVEGLKSWGRKYFETLPRVGEHISRITKEGDAGVYVVLAVFHPVDLEVCEIIVEACEAPMGYQPRRINTNVKVIGVY